LFFISILPTVGWIVSSLTVSAQYVMKEKKELTIQNKNKIVQHYGNCQSVRKIV
jgi:hypothetical protein